tara:strand:+ start:4361 stop:6016 length:1656 start_codon:yes stop_codon:yes gene_type:complete
MSLQSPLTALDKILQSNTEKERFRVQSAMDSLQIAQTIKMQKMNVAKSNIELISKSLEQIKPKIAEDFLTKSNLSKFYKPSAKGEESSVAITEMTQAILKKKEKGGMGKDFPIKDAQKIATALWSYYNANSPDAVLSLARDLNDAVGDIVSLGVQAKGSPSAKFYQGFTPKVVRGKKGEIKSVYGIGVDSNIFDVTNQAIRLQDAESNIYKEINEFAKGDYDIQSDFDIYKGADKEIEKTTDTNIVPYDRIISDMSNISSDDTIGEETWEPGLGTYIGVISSAAGGQYLSGKALKEYKRYTKGYNDFLKGLRKDLKPTSLQVPGQKYLPLNKLPSTDEDAKKFQKGREAVDKKLKKDFFKKYGISREDFKNIDFDSKDPDVIRQNRKILEPAIKKAREAGRRATKSSAVFREVSMYIKDIKISDSIKKAFQKVPGKGIIGKGLKYSPLFLAEEIGELIGGETGGFYGKAVGTTGFTAWLATRIKKRGSKFISKAVARHAAGTTASAITGPGAPVAAIGINLVMGLVDIGLAGWEIHSLIQEYKQLKSEGKI